MLHVAFLSQFLIRDKSDSGQAYKLNGFLHIERGITGGVYVDFLVFLREPHAPTFAGGRVDAIGRTEIIGQARLLYFLTQPEFACRLSGNHAKIFSHAALWADALGDDRFSLTALLLALTRYAEHGKQYNDQHGKKR